jgi:cell division protein YceG involved in septum cleavage
MEENEKKYMRKNFFQEHKIHIPYVVKLKNPTKVRQIMFKIIETYTHQNLYADLTLKELNTYNPYNTRGPKMDGKLPIGPICSASKTSIIAAIEPNNSDDLYFVADKNGKIYFAETYSEHVKIVNNLKKNNMWYEYDK